MTVAYLAPLGLLPVLGLTPRITAPLSLSLELLQQFPLVRADVFRDRYLDGHVVVAARLHGKNQRQVSTARADMIRKAFPFFLSGKLHYLPRRAHSYIIFPNI